MFKNNGYYEIEKSTEAFANHLHILSGLHVGIHDLRRIHVVSAGDRILNICEYCKKQSALFANRCKGCDKDFLNNAAQKKKPMIYSCHLGLTEAIIPIIDSGDTVGFIFLGQAISSENSPSFEEICRRLSEIDPINFTESQKENLKIAYNRTANITNEKMNSLIALAELVTRSIYMNRWLKIHSLTTEQNFQYYMNDAIDLIHIPLSSFSVEKVADDLNISYSQLNRISREVFGLPLKQYALNVKLSAAARLLISHPDMSVGDVASTVGIDNLHYFSRIFSDKMGVSCTEYRKNQKT